MMVPYSRFDEIKDEFRRRYLSESGGARLDPLPADDGDPFPGETLRRVKNDNGMLYHAEFISSCHEAGVLTNSERYAFLQGVENHRKKPGVFLRHPGNTESKECHDNYVGISGGARLCGDSEVPREIVEHLEMTGWVLPGEFIQGGDIAFLKLCADWIPALHEFLWLILSLMLAPLIARGPSRVLAGFRVRVLRKILDDQALVLKAFGRPTIAQPRHVCFGLMVATLVFDSLIWLLHRGHAGLCRRYFRPDHPIVTMLEAGHAD